MKQNFIKKAMNTLSYKDGVFLCAVLYIPLYYYYIICLCNSCKNENFFFEKGEKKNNENRKNEYK